MEKTNKTLINELPDGTHEQCCENVLMRNSQVGMMKMKFRKKPIVIEAEQWFPGKEIDGVLTKPKNLDVDMYVEPYIDTLEGRMRVSPGDWIITGINGEKYPCKPDIFDKTYEMLETWTDR